MTAVLPEKTLMEQQTDMLRQIDAILSSSPAGASLRLLITPSEMKIGADEVLVQGFNKERGVIEIRPHSITDLDPADIIHETQMIDPRDQDSIGYGSNPMASDCKYLPHRPVGALTAKGHIYVI
ncbi:hypothetical protein ACFXP3_01660 [Streptomyces sp. NPDC059096]|uniref:hypothetical protein n=1 Tax=Streptomyces sp. NPDC059096 TaxID=3346727 RepID=UPI0036BAD723